MALDTPASTVDLRTATEFDQAADAAAERTAQQGSARARSPGLRAESWSSPTTSAHVDRSHSAARGAIGRQSDMPDAPGPHRLRDGR